MAIVDAEKTSVLLVGDIIEFTSIGDTRLDGKMFLIQYSDETKIIVVGEEREKIVININDDGSFQNESITEVRLLSREESPSYAIQNGLVKDVWIDIHFSGDLPQIITGQIISLEEDQIEVKLIKSEHIYIDFAYKGIPQDIPIDKIILRNKPETELSKIVEEPAEQFDVIPEPTLLPDETFKERVRDIILEGDQIKFGERLDKMLMEIDVPYDELRYGIDRQATDLLNEMLSSIPTENRSQTVLNDIHISIQRFKQLRTEYSKFDQYGNVTLPDIRGASHKPLIDTLQHLKHKLYWILPVVMNIKKLYDNDQDVTDVYGDIKSVTLADVRNQETEIIQSFKSQTIPVGQNGYEYITKSLNEFWTPFTKPTIVTIGNVIVENNITAVVNNLHDFYSSVSNADNIISKRFLSQEYNIGLTSLESRRLIGGGNINSIKTITQPDEANIKSFLTLPESAVVFSRVNLPSTNILTKCNLSKNYIAYWRMLTDKTAVETITVSDKPLDFDETYLKKICEYVPVDGSELKYDDYLENMLPKTRVLFNLIKERIKGKLSIYSVLDYLEPFMIYQKDISFKQYQEINSFIDDKIKDWKRSYINSKNLYDKSSSAAVSKPKLLSEDKTVILEGYQIDPLSAKNVSNEEFIKLFNDVDYGRYFNTEVGMKSVSLMFPTNSLDLLKNPVGFADKYQIQLETDDQRKCRSRVLSKKYVSTDELEGDNGIAIRFDKKFDKTYYDIASEYSSELATMENDTARIAFLALKLQETVGMTENNALVDAESLVLKYKLVKDGDYAVVTDGYANQFYVRNANIWVRDNSIPESTRIDDSLIFCNLGDKCLSIKTKCDTFDKANLDIQKNTYNKMLLEFDESLTTSAEKITADMVSMSENNKNRLDQLHRIMSAKLFGFDAKMFKLGLDAIPVDEAESPFRSILDLITAQNDFIKKQTNLVKFVSQYTRPAIGGEDPWWVYCNISDAKLLPTFASDLASVFIAGGDYLAKLAIIKADQGAIGGDGDSIIDKHTGWVIEKNIDFSTEEGFTEDGFVSRSREIMGSDIGNIVVQAANAVPQKPRSIEAEKISKVMNAMSGFLGIDISQIEEFVVSETLTKLLTSVPSKTDYERESAKKTKKTDSYDIVYNKTLIMLTASFLLIGIQTSVPTIKSRKTHPGCVKSFSGYPLTATGDKGGLNYIACVIHSIKSSIEPWDSIGSMSQKSIVTKIEELIGKHIITMEPIKELIRIKNDFNITDHIPEVHDIVNWINFLPPLRTVNVIVISPTAEFYGTLLRAINQGSKEQFTMINAYKSKIIYIALSIELAIQKVVTRNIADNKAILVNSSSSNPFIENACCNDSNEDTYTYFSSREASINIDNDVARNIRAVIDEVNIMSKAPILFDSSDTRASHTSLVTGINEITIYKAFISYCKYGSTLPISKDIMTICNGKPDDFDVTDKIEEQIINLKKTGKVFTSESLANLMTIINRQNIIEVYNSTSELTNVEKLTIILNEIKDSEYKVFPKEFLDKFIAVLKIGIHEYSVDPPLVKDFKNYLHTTGDEMLRKLGTFVDSNSPKKKVNEAFNICIGNIIREQSEDNDIYSTELFMKNALSLLISVFPSIIINKINYDNIKIQNSWALSDIHEVDLKNHAKDHFAPLKQFYDDVDSGVNININMMLQEFHDEGKKILQLSANTLYLSPSQTEKGRSKNIFDKRMVHLLFRFYILNTFSFLASLSGLDRFYTAPVKILRPLSSGTLLVEVMYTAGDQTSDMLAGDKKQMSQTISNIVVAFADMACGDKKTVDMSYEDMMDKVTRSKEKERDVMVEFLTDLSDSEREVENMFKNLRMGKWSVGIQKGYKQYDTDTYDKEREDIEKRALIDIKTNKADGVTGALSEVFALGAMADAEEAEIIEAEELGIDDYRGEDDNDRDEDFGDEY